MKWILVIVPSVLGWAENGLMIEDRNRKIVREEERTTARQKFVLPERKTLSQRPGAVINRGCSRFSFSSDPASGFSCFNRAE